MQLGRTVAVALVATLSACMSGDHAMGPASHAPRMVRTGHAKPISALRLPPGVSLSLAAPVNGIAVQDMTQGVTAQALAQALVGPGVTISNVSYTGAPGAAALFSADTAVLGVGDGIVLSTGKATSVIGPNLLNDVTTDWGLPGDADLSALVNNDSTFDASVLQFDFVPDSSTVYIAAYVFGSDEYNEFVNTEFNDAMAFYVNGTNCALIGGLPVSINAINNGSPYGTDPRSNPDLFRNNSLTDGGGSINTELDGLTRVLTCTAAVNKGVVNHVKLAIADVYDGTFDSDVFIGGGALTTTPPKVRPIPHAVAKWSIAPDCVRDGAIVTLDASGSSEPGGSLVNYQWFYGNSQGQVYGVGPVVTRHFDPFGAWPMTLVVTDASGQTAEQAFSFTVNKNPAPVNAFAVGPATLSPPNGNYTKMQVTATSTGVCPATLSVVASSSQGDAVNPTGDQPGDIRVVHNDGTATVSSNATPTVTFNPATDTLYLRAETLDSVTNRTYTLVMSANGTPADTATIVVPHPVKASVDGWVIFANDQLRMSGNARTDGFNPALGPYNPQRHDSTGSVAAVTSIRFDGQNPRVQGNATSGGTISSGANVTGTRTQNAALQLMPVVACPAGAYSPASVISGSQYRYNANQGSLSVSGNGTVVLNGAGPFFFSSLSLSGNSTLSVSSGVHVDVYVSNDFSASGNGIANAAAAAGGIAFIACGSPSRPSTWQISGNGASYFTLYAPNHDVQISGNGQLFGCLVGDDITMSGNAQVHYDESLGAPCASGTSGGGGAQGDVGPGTGGSNICADGGKKGSDGKCNCDKSGYRGWVSGSHDHDGHGSVDGDHDNGHGGHGDDDGNSGHGDHDNGNGGHGDHDGGNGGGHGHG